MSTHFRFILYGVIAMVASVVSISAFWVSTSMAEAATVEERFSDDFESGNFTEWNEADSAWSISGGDTNSGSYRASANGTSSNQTIFLRKDFDTTGYENITLVFWYRLPGDGFEANEKIQVYGSDDGSSFGSEGSVTEADETASWTKRTVTFPDSIAADNPAFAFRFGIFADTEADEFQLDDVELTGEPISADEEVSEEDTSEAPDTSGTSAIRVCKTLLDAEGDVTAGADGEGSFAIELTGPDSFATTTTEFSTTLNYDQDFYDFDDTQAEELNDATCVVYENLSAGDYYYDEETVTPAADFAAARYNDGNNGVADSKDDFLPFDESGDYASDGHIVLQEDEERTLVVLNQAKPRDEEDETEPVPGCTDETAVNYDPDATQDDDSCVEYTEEVLPDQCLANNLLDNGSFEAPKIDIGSPLISNPAAWSVVTAAGGDSAPLEFHRAWNGNVAAAGAQYVELDGYDSVTISQTANGLESEAEYTLFWDFAPRQNIDAANNHLTVALDGVTVATSGPESISTSDAITQADWLAGSHTFTATGTAVDVSFTDVGIDNSYGTFLDDAVLCKTAHAPEPETWTWEGHKYRDEAGSGELGEGLVGEPNWKMELVWNSDGLITVLATTTTDANGDYKFTLAADEVPEGARFSDIAVREEDREGWTPTGVYADSRSQEYNPAEVVCGAFSRDEGGIPEIPGNDFRDGIDPIVDVPRLFTVQCDFLNEPPEETEPDDPVEEVEEEDDGTTYGTRVRRTPQPEPQVLGAATGTDAVASCGRLLSDYMQRGEAPNEQQVTLLQIFLNGQGYLTPITGTFDEATDTAVRKFQSAHQEDVLVPWFEAGLMDHSNPTGYVYRTTRWKINNIICPGSEEFPELR